MIRLTHRIVPGLVAGSLLVSMSAGAFAAKAPVKAAKVVVETGQVSALTTGTTPGFTLTFTPKKAGATPKVYQVLTTATTKEVGAAAAPAGGLQNGEYAIVVGTSTTAGITARNIRYSTTAFSARAVTILRLRLELAALTAPKVRVARGTVVAAQTTATALVVTVTTKTGTKTDTFAITTATKFRIGKTLATAAPQLTDGEKVAVRYRANKATKALDALAVSVPATS